MSAATKWIAGISATTVAAVVVILVFGFYYYVTTPAEIYVIVGNEFPPNFSPGFTADELANDLLAATGEIRAGADKKASPTNAQLGSQIAPADRPPTYWPLRDSFPTFDVKLKGIRLSAVHDYAVSKRARHLIAIDTFAMGKGNFRLRARLLDKPGDERHSVSAPADGGICPDSEKCARELAEEILSLQQPRALLSYYAEQQEYTASRKIIRLFDLGRIPKDSKGKLAHDDLSAWAAALRDVGEYNQAIHKYRESQLATGGPLCNGYDEIGYTYLVKYDADNRPQDLDGAESSYREALKCNSNNAIAYCDLGAVSTRKWMRSGETDDHLAETALKQFERSWAIDPTLVVDAVNIAFLRYQRGEHEQALAYFREIDQKFPDNATLLLNFGAALYLEYLNGKGDLLDDALDKTQRAWDVDRKSYAAASNLGFLYFETGSLQKAVNYWNEAYKLKSSEPDVVAGLALGLFDSNQPEKAIERFVEAKQMEGDIGNPETLRTRHHWSRKAIEHMMALAQAANTAKTQTTLQTQF